MLRGWVNCDGHRNRQGERLNGFLFVAHRPDDPTQDREGDNNITEGDVVFTDLDVSWIGS